MLKNVTPEEEVVVQAPEGNGSDRTRPEPPLRNANTTRPLRNDFLHSTSSREFLGDTTKIGGVLGLPSKNITKKVAFDVFCEEVSIYVMTEFKNGEKIVEILKHPDTKVIDDFQNSNKSK